MILCSAIITWHVWQTSPKITWYFLFNSSYSHTNPPLSLGLRKENPEKKPLCGILSEILSAAQQGEDFAGNAALECGYFEAGWEREPGRTLNVPLSLRIWWKL